MQSNVILGNFTPAEDQTVKAAAPAASSQATVPYEGVDGICPVKYQILGVIGSGGMGTVYKAKQILLDRFVAIKMLNKCDGSEEAIMRFQQEARAASSLSHPNLNTFRDFSVTDSGKPYIVMDFIEGPTLSDRIKNGGPFDVDQALDIFMQALCGLQHAHERGVLHRDIKPGNIMLSESDPIAYVKIVDFGIAKAANSTQHLTQTGEVFGTPLYMSPEQGLGKTLDARSDLYSLGCVMYEALTGEPPFKGESAIETIFMHQTQDAPPLARNACSKQVPQSLEQVVSRLLAKNPDERYQTAYEAKQAVAAISSKMNASSVTEKLHALFAGLKRPPVAARDKSVLATIESIIIKSVLIISVSVFSSLTIIWALGVLLQRH